MCWNTALITLLPVLGYCTHTNLGTVGLRYVVGLHWVNKHLWITKLFTGNLSAKYLPFIRSLSKCILFPTLCILALGKSKCCKKVEQRWDGGHVEVGWLSGLCKWVREVCIRCLLDPVGPGYQSTRQTVMSSHGQLVTHASHHKGNSSQASSRNFFYLHAG